MPDANQFVIPAEFEKILDLHTNRVAIAGLVRAIRNERLAMIVGEGVPAAMGYPTWFEFFGRLGKQCGIPAAEVDHLINNEGQAGIAARVRKEMGDLAFYDAVETEYGAEQVRRRPLRGPILALSRFIGAQTSVISLNIDPSFEQMLAAMGLERTRPPVFDTPVSLIVGAGELMKVRGSAWEREGCLISDEVRKGFSWADLVRSGETRMPYDLQELLDDRVMLFTGFSLPHKNILTYLSKESRKPKFILLKYRGVEASVRLASQLSVHKLRPIWYFENEPESIEWIYHYAANMAELAPMHRALAAIQPPAAAVHVAAEPQTPTPVAMVDRLKIPESLAASCATGECVLLAGSGLSARSGLPTWGASLGELIDWAVEKRVIDDGMKQELSEALSLDRNAVADQLFSAFEQRKDLLTEFGWEKLARKVPISHAHSMLGQIRFGAVLTSNLDELIEQTFRHGYELKYTPMDAEAVLDAFAAKKKFILKLYGDLHRPETVIFSPAEYKSSMSKNMPFTRFMEAAFFSRTLFFVGVSVEGLADFLESFPFRGEGNPRRHYAIVADLGPAARVKARLLDRRYNVDVVSYDPANNHQALEDFLSDLVKAVAAHPASGDTGAAALGQGRLTKVSLRDIGPFESLDVELPAPWRIILGDNGVGKTTILKAIAIAIVGSDANDFAGRIVRSGKSMGTVTLYTDSNPHGYLTEIHKRDASRAEVVSKPSRPLEAENWVAIGFPPLRTVTWQASGGPQAPVRGRPSSEDLLPLIRGEADPRMDKLKQWIINQDYIHKRNPDTKDGARAEATIHKFFEIVGKLTEGNEAAFETVTDDFQVLVRNKDGVVPIESLSQGMTSLYSWVGILVQRMFEIHDTALGDPTEQHAIVLMDEVDAHMHPVWQQKLVERLKAVFPKVQMLVTTHSPLIVGGLAANEVARYGRGAGGQVVEQPVTQDMLMGRADQVLTGRLFGMKSTLDGTTQAKLKEYREAVSNSDGEPSAEVAKLESELSERIPPSGETPLERHAHELVLAVFESMSAVSTEKARTLKAAADKVATALDDLHGLSPR